MAEPKKKLSKTRTGLRRSQYKIKSMTGILCSHCGDPIMPHTICTHCGYYKNKPTRLVRQKRILAQDSTEK